MHGDGVIGWLGGWLVYFLVVGDLNARWGRAQKKQEMKKKGQEEKFLFLLLCPPKANREISPCESIGLQSKRKEGMKRREEREEEKKEGCKQVGNGCKGGRNGRKGEWEEWEEGRCVIVKQSTRLSPSWACCKWKEEDSCDEISCIFFASSHWGEFPPLSSFFVSLEGILVRKNSL